MTDVVAAVVDDDDAVVFGLANEMLEQSLLIQG